MSDRIQAIRGMNDVLPNQSYAWRHLEQNFINCLSYYGYQEIRLPLLENAALFKRTIGEVTDIVEKEMYTFTDLNGESIALRPEGTAGCVRACLEHGLLHNQQQRLWYIGPMFRHERPQKGRYRQFYHLGVEVFGIPGVGIELELIAICKRLWQALGILDQLSLEINTLGELVERQAYRQALVNYLRPLLPQLDDDSKRRLEKNPLRILDSKNPQIQALLVDAPKILDSLGEKSRKHFDALCEGLQHLGISYTVNPCLVRGLDYYGHSVFEWTTDKLGSQATVCAGGRFDGLVEQLGGHPTPAVGFAMGEERLLLLMTAMGQTLPADLVPPLFLVIDGELALQQALIIAESLRNRWPVSVNIAGGSFKSQFKKADKSGASFALILGDNEVRDKTIGIKSLRKSEEQITIAQANLNDYLEKILS